jgi:hypothetical protein
MRGGGEEEDIDHRLHHSGPAPPNVVSCSRHIGHIKTLPVRWLYGPLFRRPAFAKRFAQPHALPGDGAGPLQAFAQAAFVSAAGVVVISGIAHVHIDGRRRLCDGTCPCPGTCRCTCTVRRDVRWVVHASFLPPVYW